jgi:hypothetical protein
MAVKVRIPRIRIDSSVSLDTRLRGVSAQLDRSTTGRISCHTPVPVKVRSRGDRSSTLGSCAATLRPERDWIAAFLTSLPRKILVDYGTEVDSGDLRCGIIVWSYELQTLQKGVTWFHVDNQGDWQTSSLFVSGSNDSKHTIQSALSRKMDSSL